MPKEKITERTLLKMWAAWLERKEQPTCIFIPVNKTVTKLGRVFARNHKIKIKYRTDGVNKFLFETTSLTFNRIDESKKDDDGKPEAAV
jgi:hypothetical protein